MAAEPINTLEITIQFSASRPSESGPIVAEHSRADVQLPTRSEGVFELISRGTTEIGLARRCFGERAG